MNFFLQSSSESSEFELLDPLIVLGFETCDNHVFLVFSDDKFSSNVIAPESEILYSNVSVKKSSRFPKSVNPTI